MSDVNEAKLKDLEAKKVAGTITPEEEVVRVALLELDEKTEDKATADKALADAIAANPAPAPDPVGVAHQAVVDAQAALVVAQKAVDDAVAALPVVPVV